MKVTIDANTDDMILAVRAAKKLAETPDCKETLILFEGGAEFYVRRLKSGYSVRQTAPQVTNGT
jgi:hypothetical protein